MEEEAPGFAVSRQGNQTAEAVDLKRVAERQGVGTEPIH